MDKKIELYIKLSLHLLSFLLFTFGIVIFHTVINITSNKLYFFDIILSRNFVVDFGFCLIIISFSIQFLLSCKITISN